MSHGDTPQILSSIALENDMLHPSFDKNQKIATVTALLQDHFRFYIEYILIRTHVNVSASSITPLECWQVKSLNIPIRIDCDCSYSLPGDSARSLLFSHGSRK